MAGRPRKNALLGDVELNMVETEVIVREPVVASVHNMIRWISKKNYENPELGYFNVYTVDAHVAEWLNKGYYLFNTHYLGENPEAYAVLYVFVKD